MTSFKEISILDFNATSSRAIRTLKEIYPEGPTRPGSLRGALNWPEELDATKIDVDGGTHIHRCHFKGAGASRLV